MGVSGNRTSRSVDVFSLGCIFYCTLIPGSHPFGDWYEREANIIKNHPFIDGLREISADASELVLSIPC
jgi:serine/threonine-protein kinase/endoribonuclease IRE1